MPPQPAPAHLPKNYYPPLKPIKTIFSLLGVLKTIFNNYLLAAFFQK